MLGHDPQENPEPDGSEPFVDQSRKVQFLFDKIDVNKDGKVTMEEFIEVCNQDENLAKLLCVGTGAGP